MLRQYPLALPSRYSFRFMVPCLLLMLALAGCGGGGGSGGGGDNEERKALVTTTALAAERVEFKAADLVSIQSAVSGYQWRQLRGTAVSIEVSTAAAVSFNAPDVSTTELLAFELEVNTVDGLAYIVPIELTVVNESQVLAVEDESYFLKERVRNGSCTAPTAPPSVSPIKLERVFPNIDTPHILDMDQAPGDDSAWYAIKRGKRTIERFANNNAVGNTEVVLNRSYHPAALRSLAFHPDFSDNGKIYLSTIDASLTIASSNVWELTWSTSLNAFDPDSERLVLQIDSPHTNLDNYNHPGGTMHFGPDGYLYIALGDFTQSGVFNTVSQQTDNLWGSLLRIDVDSDVPYGIPADNPFANGGGRAEIFAWGFRHPWKWSFDRANGDIWLGDVGWSQREEINQVVSGGNYGWPIREGSIECARCEIDQTVPGVDPGALIEPLHDYDRDVGKSVTGGYVYRGGDIPDLQGVYVFADYVTGSIFALRDTGKDNKTRESLAQADIGVATFSEDVHGELYVVDIDHGGIYKLVSNVVEKIGDFPATLSATNCVDMSDPRAVLPGMIPYTLQMPLWSDGATKQRWMALPDGQQIAELEGSGGDLDFPAGTVLVKHFSLRNQLIETRLFMRHNDGKWGGYSYEWNDSQTEAFLLPGAKVKQVGDVEWRYPSRTQCLQCHTEEAGRALGPTTRQLNTYHSGGHALYSQMQMLSDIGLFAFEPDNSLAFPTLNNVDAPAEERARAYLDSNCSGCHRPGGGSGRSTMDLRAETAFADMNICNVRPIVDNLGIPEADLLKPGNAANSIIYSRMTTRDVYRMPPIGTGEVHEDAVRLIEEWINGLEECD